MNQSNGIFNQEAIKNIRNLIGTFPVVSIPHGVELTFNVPKIEVGNSGELMLKISKDGAEEKELPILVKVTSNILININDEESARNNTVYKAGNIRIGDNVGAINYDLSSLTDKDNKKYDIKSINWGNNSQNILEIGENAFASAQLTNIDLSSLTNLTEIGKNAFMNPQFAELDLSKLVDLITIGDGAFKSSPLSKLNLLGADKLMNIGSQSFNSVIKYMKLKMSSDLYYKLIYNVSKSPKLNRRSDIFGHRV